MVWGVFRLAWARESGVVLGVLVGSYIRLEL